METIFVWTIVGFVLLYMVQRFCRRIKSDEICGGCCKSCDAKCTDPPHEKNDI